MNVKPVFVSLIAGVSLLAAIVLLNPKKENQLEPQQVVGSKFISFGSIAKTPLQPLEDWTPLDPLEQAPPPIPNRMLAATDDPYVAQFLNTFTPHEIGQIERTEEGTQKLIMNGKLMFEAYHIGSRSVSTDETLYVEAITGDLPSGTKLGGEFFDKPREIWQITPKGIKSKISPTKMDASSPVISPDGTKLAFTGCDIDEAGLIRAPRLYILNLVSGNARVYGTRQHVHDYKVRAIDWHLNGTVLRVIEDWGETGGHMKLKQVRTD